MFEYIVECLKKGKTPEIDFNCTQGLQNVEGDTPPCTCKRCISNYRDSTNSIKNILGVIAKQDAEIQEQEKRIKKLEEDAKLASVGFSTLFGR